MARKKMVDQALWAFIDATNACTPGGGIAGYQHMLERVAATMACDHGGKVVERVFAAIAKQHAEEAATDDNELEPTN